MAKRVLIVDDMPVNLKFLGLILKGKADEIVEAHSAEEAFEHLQGEAFHAAFLDVQLPGMDGFSLCSEIKTIMPSTRVVMLSGNAPTEDMMEKTQQAGAELYLTKPFDRDACLSVLED